MSKDNAVEIMTNFYLNEKMGYYNFFSCLNIRKTDYLLSKK